MVRSEFATTPGAVAGRAALRLLLVPVLAGVGFGGGELFYELTGGPVLWWLFAGPVWGYAGAWPVTSIVRMATAGRRPTRLLLDHTGVTVTDRAGRHVLPWGVLDRLEVRRRGVNLRPVLFALPRRGAATGDDPFWRSRLASDGALRVADLRTLRAARATVLSAAAQYLP